MAKKLSTDKLRKAATTARRSSLYLWMLENFDTFSATVSEAGRPNWSALAEIFGAEGLRDLKGNRPSAEGTRQTWWKVRKAVAKRRGGSPEPPEKPTPTKPDVADEEDPPATRPTFQYGKLR